MFAFWIYFVRLFVSSYNFFFFEKRRHTHTDIQSKVAVSDIYEEKNIHNCFERALYETCIFIHCCT